MDNTIRTSYITTLSSKCMPFMKCFARVHRSGALRCWCCWCCCCWCCCWCCRRRSVAGNLATGRPYPYTKEALALNGKLSSQCKCAHAHRTSSLTKTHAFIRFCAACFSFGIVGIRIVHAGWCRRVGVECRAYFSSTFQLGGWASTIRFCVVYRTFDKGRRRRRVLSNTLATRSGVTRENTPRLGCIWFEYITYCVLHRNGGSCK